jgi:hypothetical protein
MRHLAQHHRQRQSRWQEILLQGLWQKGREQSR